MIVSILLINGGHKIHIVDWTVDYFWPANLIIDFSIWIASNLWRTCTISFRGFGFQEALLTSLSTNNETSKIFYNDRVEPFYLFTTIFFINTCTKTAKHLILPGHIFPKYTHTITSGISTWPFSLEYRLVVGGALI